MTAIISVAILAEGTVGAALITLGLGQLVALALRRLR
jgi:hypothetical protein